MDLPRLNNFSFWLLLVSLGSLLGTLLMLAPGPKRWLNILSTLICQRHCKQGLFYLFYGSSRHLFSLIETSKMMVTIVNRCTPSMGYMQTPIFV